MRRLRIRLKPFDVAVGTFDDNDGIAKFKIDLNDAETRVGWGLGVGSINFSVCLVSSKERVR
jgi:hypothetical protein